MVIVFDHSFGKALENIDFIQHQEFIVYDLEEVRTHHNSCELLENYGNLKWEIIEILNKTYGTNFNLLNWLNNEDDEVAHFINETGSNALSYSEFKMPSKFHLWFGRIGFIIGIEQLGKGFNAETVHNLRLKQNEGKAFDFFRKCKSIVFFDDKKEARIVYLNFLFSN